MSAEGAVRAGLVAAGALLVLAGVVGSARAAEQTGPLASWVSLVVAAVAHDLLVAPALVVAGVVVARVVPQGLRAVVQVALLVSGGLVVVALPLVLGLGRREDDPSALPLDYGRGLALSLAAVWVGAGAVLAVRALRRRRSRLTM